MSSLVIAAFGGMFPKRGARLLAEHMATEAVNVQARTGYLAGRSAHSALTAVSAGTKSVYRIDDGGSDVYLEFDTVNVSVARSPLANDAFKRYYWAGDGMVPQFNTLDRINDSYPAYQIGIPPKLSGVTLSIETAGSSGVAETRYYVITYVDEFGNESSPSKVQKIDCTNDDDSVRVDWDTRPGYPGVYAPLELVRVYRTVSGISTTAFHYVTEADFTDYTVVDAVATDDVAYNDELYSTQFDKPPSDLSGLVTLPNGFMAGWLDRDVYFSEPYRPHAWPSGYRVTVEDEIVGLGVFEQNLAILTTGTPFIASGVNPEAMSLAKLPPASGCVSRRSIVEVAGAVIYASRDGLVAIDASGQHLLTKNLILREDWGANYAPSSLVAARTRANTYLAFYGGASGFELDFDDPDRGLVKVAYPHSVDGVDSDPYGENATITSDLSIWRYEDDYTAPETYTWRSKPFFMTTPVNFGAAQVNTGEELRPLNDAVTYTVQLRAYADGALIFDEEVPTDTPFKLPSGFKGQVWQFEFEGDLTISRFAVAETESELSRV